ncbi:MAG: VOC family protein [Sulfobacillus sp.]
MRPWVTGINVITLFVEDLARAKAFYQEVFDLPPSFETHPSAVFKFPNMMVNLLEVSAAPGLIAPAPVANAPQGSRFMLSVFVDDVDAVCAELTKRAIALINGPMNRPWGMRTACFSDPAGHIWEVGQDHDPDPQA